MSTHRFDIMEQPLSRKITWTVLLFLSLVFFFSGHDLQIHQISSVDFHERLMDRVGKGAIEGSLPRRLAFFTLVLFSFFWMKTKWSRSLHPYRPLAWTLIFFAAWSCASLAWSIDPSMTFRRLLVLAALSLGALAMTVSFPVNFLPFCVFVVTTIYLLLGISVELLSGTFHPLTHHYRFAGTVHPNVQGINCGLMFLASLSLSRNPESGRYFFLTAALVAFLAMILTKSRTSFGGVLLAQSILIMATSSRYRIVGYVLGFSQLLVLLFLFFQDRFLFMATQVGLLGRGTDEFSTATGRTDLWEDCIHYIFNRPFHGYGFHGFWGPGRIREYFIATGNFFSNAHSAYIDLLLGIGLAGFLSYLLTLVFSVRKAYKNFIDTRETGYGFLFALLIFCAANGLLESDIIDFSSFESFVFLWGLFILAFCSPKKDPEPWNSYPIHWPGRRNI